MKCECGKKISIWDIILPWRMNYAILVSDDDGKVIEKVRVCRECYEMYQMVTILIGRMGQKKFFEYMDKLEKMKGDENV